MDIGIDIAFDILFRILSNIEVICNKQNLR